MFDARSLFCLLALLLAGMACSCGADSTAECPDELKRCGSHCVDTESDAEHCGSCGNACPQGETCVEGGCVEPCEGEERRCDGRCVLLDSDPRHCGACGEACSESEVCAGGSCVEGCPDGLKACEGRCVDATRDPAHCGGCRIACDDGIACKDGRCDCPSDLWACDGACVNLWTDAAHCGKCGKDCSAGTQVDEASCEAGVCVPTCKEGYAACGGDPAEGCTTHLLTDTANCGDCGHACAPGAECVNGLCRCPEGTEDCGGECVDLDKDAHHCGSCGYDCQQEAGVESASCVMGACVPTQCATGWADCGEEPGCETNVYMDADSCGTCGKSCVGAEICQLGACVCPAGSHVCDGLCRATQSDAAHCGGCGNDCSALPNVVDAACSFGICVPTCKEGWAHCPGDEGCETHTDSDESNCGFCGNECRADMQCIAGSCQCAPGQADCGGACIDILDDPANCGGCGETCLGQPNATRASCEAGSCVFECVEGYLDCDPEAPGCESELGSDASCSSCEDMCGAGEHCSHQLQCVCEAGLESCPDGCVDLDRDAANCGSCGKVCPEGQVCEEGSCYVPCGANQKRCDGVCTNVRTDSRNCGDCGVDCLELANVNSAICSQGACQLACETSWAHCEGDEGCDTWVEDSDEHCGACGNACGLDQHCASSSCVCDDPALSNCYGECVDTERDLAHCGACGEACGISCGEGFCFRADRLPKTHRETMVAVMSDGRLFSWGANWEGSLGRACEDGNLLFCSRQALPGPVEFSLPEPVKELSGGHHFTCALLADGRVACWGSNRRKQLGVQSSSPSLTPVFVEDGHNSHLEGVLSVATGEQFACALVEGGRVKCWGDNKYGTVGTGTSDETVTRAADVIDPFTQQPLEGVRALAAGVHHVCAVMENGDLRCWGRNQYGQIGNGSSGSDVFAPSAPVLDDVAEVAPADDFTCALLTDGSAKCWGRNTWGQLGLGYRDETTPILSPSSVISLTGATRIFAGYGRACALMEGGSAKCWGHAASGKLGNGLTKGVDSPAAPTDLLRSAGEPFQGIEQIALGYRSSCVLTDAGAVFCFGENVEGSLGIGFGPQDHLGVPYPWPEVVAWPPSEFP